MLWARENMPGARVPHIPPLPPLAERRTPKPPALGASGAGRPLKVCIRTSPSFAGQGSPHPSRDWAVPVAQSEQKQGLRPLVTFGGTLGGLVFHSHTGETKKEGPQE